MNYTELTHLSCTQEETNDLEICRAEPGPQECKETVLSLPRQVKDGAGDR